MIYAMALETMPREYCGRNNEIDHIKKGDVFELTLKKSLLSKKPKPAFFCKIGPYLPVSHIKLISEKEFCEIIDSKYLKKLQPIDKISKKDLIKALHGKSTLRLQKHSLDI